MIYNLIQADEILSRLDNDFNINVGSWVNRIPQWIYQCLGDLNIYLGLLPKSHIADVVNYTAEIPEDLKSMIGIEYRGRRLERRATGMYKNKTEKMDSFAFINTNIGVRVTGTLNSVTMDSNLNEVLLDVSKIRTYDSSTINELPRSDEYYYLHPTGKIETSFKSGIVFFHYYTLPAHYNDRLNSLCPLVPDNEAVKDAIVWYIFKAILQRGSFHPVFKLGAQNPILDPYYMYKEARRKARNSANLEDRDAARIIDRMWQSALYNTIALER